MYAIATHALWWKHMHKFLLQHETINTYCTLLIAFPSLKHNIHAYTPCSYKLIQIDTLTDAGSDPKLGKWFVSCML